MDKELLEYYNGDEFAAGVWYGKYAIKKGNAPEETPNDMHARMTSELASCTPIEFNKLTTHYLSEFGQRCPLNHSNYAKRYTYIRGFLDRYKWIIPQGSIMTMLGNYGTIGSLSNCFVIPPPLDSYGGIFKTDQQIAQLEKRRGGVGTNLNTLRPDSVPVMNAAGTSTGAHSFMDRYSNTTREVAQNGRRGALMLLMSCLHPDIFRFVTKKSDLTKVTGANVSSMLTDEFMRAALADEDFICRFPIDREDLHAYDTTMQTGIGYDINPIELVYNQLYNFVGRDGEDFQVMKIKAKELLDLIIEMAWQNGEPGLAFIDTIVNYSPEGVYEEYKPIASNPCGEQWMQAYDACRLLAMNLFSLVVNPYTKDAYLDMEKLYEVAYMQQRLGDMIVDLEIKAVQRIINKIKEDPEPDDVKATELDLWENVQKTAAASRRTGCGFTGLADMLAALGLKYDSDEALEVIKTVCKEKMRGELDCTIDMAIQLGPFKGWDVTKEFEEVLNQVTPGLFPVYDSTPSGRYKGKNAFYQMLLEEFPEQAARMMQHGRRNCSWSTVAPTGTVSIVAILKKYANLTAGIEPVYSTIGFRNKKVNPSDEGVEVAFTDQNGDAWQTFPIMMGGLKEWVEVNEDKAAFIGVDNLPLEVMKELHKKSPYYGSEANDISWEKRIAIQAVVQRYTTNAISSTLNLPNNVTKETVKQIYETAWIKGLKGVTVYRDGCRTGVLTTTATAKKDEFDYSNSTKRPRDLKGDLYVVTVKGERYTVAVGLLNEKPYEVFAFKTEASKQCSGIIRKVKKNHYDFICEDKTIINGLEAQDLRNDEAVLTRLVSGMLRHGAAPKYVCEQIEKCDLEIVSYGKAISRVLNKYVPKEDLKGNCPECKVGTLRKEEGCVKCTNCSYSKC